MNKMNKILKLNCRSNKILGKDFSKKEIYTCNKCKKQDDCKCAWDMYNIDGDCLAEK